MSKPQIYLTIALVILGLASNVYAWNPPTSTPPYNNTPPPINIGPESQQKDGGLGVGALAVYGKTVLIGNVKITSGTPGPGKFLIADDDKGNASWRTIKVNP